MEIVRELQKWREKLMVRNYPSRKSGTGCKNSILTRNFLFRPFFKEMTTLLSFMNFVFDNIGRNSPYANNPEVFGKLDRVIQLLRSRNGEQLSFSLKVLVLNSRH